MKWQRWQLLYKDNLPKPENNRSSLCLIFLNLRRIFLLLCCIVDDKTIHARTICVFSKPQFKNTFKNTILKDLYLLNRNTLSYLHLMRANNRHFHFKVPSDTCHVTPSLLVAIFLGMAVLLRSVC